VYAEELTVENAAEREGVEEAHDALVDFLVVLVETCIAQTSYIPNGS